MKFKLLNENFLSKSKFLFLTTAVSGALILLLFYLFSIWKIEFSGFNALLLILTMWFVIGVGIRWSLSDWVKKKDVVGKIVLHEDRIVVFRKEEEVFNFSDWNIGQVNKNHYQGFTPRDMDSMCNGVTSIQIKNEKGEVLQFKFLIEDSESYYRFEMYLERNI